MHTHLTTFIKFYFRSFQGLPSTAWRGIVLALIDAIMISVYYFISIYFLNELHFSVTTCATIISCHGLGAIVGARIGGKLSDMISPTLVSALSLLVQAVGYFALVKLSTITGIMVDAFILGAASYAFITSNHFWTLQHCTDAERLKAIYYHFNGEMVWYISLVIGILCFVGCIVAPLLHKLVTPHWLYPTTT